MEKNQSFNAAATYESPQIRTVKLSPRAHYLQTGSPYGMTFGEPGEAGAGGSFNDGGGEWF